jgi:hypothetical protein
MSLLACLSLTWGVVTDAHPALVWSCICLCLILSCLTVNMYTTHLDRRHADKTAYEKTDQKADQKTRQRDSQASEQADQKTRQDHQADGQRGTTTAFPALPFGGAVVSLLASLHLQWVITDVPDDVIVRWIDPGRFREAFPCLVWSCICLWLIFSVVTVNTYAANLNRNKQRAGHTDNKIRQVQTYHNTSKSIASKDSDSRPHADCAVM